MQRFTIRWSGLPGGEAINVLHSTGEGDEAAQSFRDRIMTVLNGLALGIYENATWNVDPLVPTIEVASGEALDFSPVTGTGGSGQSGFPVLPQNVMLLVRFSTPTVIAGRRVQGRMFFPGITNESDVNGQPNGTTIANVSAAFAPLLALEDNAQLAVYSRPVKDSGGVITRPGQECPVNGTTVWSEWAQLGKRRS